MSDLIIHDSWKEILSEELSSDDFIEIIKYLNKRREMGAVIYPPNQHIFNAFNNTLFDNIKVVILGQDPYHKEGVANGLCFSVNSGMRIPPSLRNIFKELHSDLGCEIPSKGDLSKWANQGVFLLNAILTVDQKMPASHQKIGWEKFTDAVIKRISDKKDGVVFILWGAFAQRKRVLINEQKHLILAAPHPAAEVYAGGKAGFFGSKPFSKTNAYLKVPINWELV